MARAIKYGQPLWKGQFKSETNRKSNIHKLKLKHTRQWIQSLGDIATAIIYIAWWMVNGSVFGIGFVDIFPF